MSGNFKIIAEKKIRVAVVGCGRIATKHLNAIRDLKTELYLVAVCDVITELAKKTSQVFDCAYYTDFSALIAAEDLDCVILCTPSGLHAKQTIAAARLGINILVEKPMATSYADGLKMINECDVSGVRLFVVKQNRLNPTVKLLKQAITEERFGKLILAQTNVFWTRPQEYYSQGSGWRGTWEFDGGALMNQASHYFDLLNWLLGPVDKVHAMTSTTRKIEAEDTGVVNLRWRNGLLGSVAVTMLTYPKNLEGSITIIGEKGTVKIGGIALNEIQMWDFMEKHEMDAAITSSNYQTASVYGNGHASYYQNFIAVMRGAASPVADGRCGIKSLEMIIAAYMSARDDRAIGIPLSF